MRAHRPAPRGTDPGPVRRRRRGGDAVDRRHGVALPPDLRLGRIPPGGAARPGGRGTRHPRDDRAERPRGRHDREPAPLVPLPGRAPPPTRRQRARGHLRRARPGRRPAVRAARRRAPPRQPPPVQRAPQERVELRLGLGRRRGDERHLALDRHRVVERRADRRRPSPRRRRRHHRRAHRARRRRARRHQRRLPPAHRVRARGRGLHEHRPGGAGHRLRHGASVSGSRPVTGGRAAGSATVRLELPDVAVWWPRGHGEQPLYDVRVEVGDDVWAGRVGFRTVTLDTAATPAAPRSCSGSTTSR